jgi:hypothetical protein
MDAPELSDPSDLPSLCVLASELAAYHSTGSLLHLAHAARAALDDTRAELEGFAARASAWRTTTKDIAA